MSITIHFALDSLMVANRSPAPTSFTNEFLGPFDDIWRVWGRRFRLIYGGGRGSKPESNKQMFNSL